MKRKTVSMPDDFNLYLMGDWHVGNAAFARERLKRDIKRIKRDKKGFVGLMGDLCEAIHLGDKRYAPDVHHGKLDTIDSQAEEVANILRPIKDRVLWVLTGNHEMKLDKIADPTRLIVKDLGIDVPYGAFSVKIRLTERLNVFAIHGAGSVRSRAGDRKQVEINDGIRIKRKLKDLAGDCALMAMGHIHTIRTCAPEPHLALVDDGEGGIEGVYRSPAVSPEGVIEEEDRFYCSTGSYLRGFMDDVTTYSEKFMYPPTEIGGIKCTVSNKELVKMEKWLK